MPQRSRFGYKSWLAASIPSVLSIILGHSALAKSKTVFWRANGLTAGVPGLDPAMLQDDGTLVQFGVETLIEGSVEYNPNTCVFISSGTYKPVTNPLYGVLSFGVLMHTVPQGYPCAGYTYQYAVVYYTWTNSQTMATQDSFTVNWSTPDGRNNDNYTDYVTLDLSVPKIVMNNINVTDANPPTTVAIGQKIVLSLFPMPNNASGFQWHIPGTYIGKYKAVPCEGHECKACNPCTKDAKTGNSSVEFY